MRPVLVVVANVLGHQAFQVALVENDDMIEQIAAAVPDPALGHAIMPGAANGSANRNRAQTLYGL